MTSEPEPDEHSDSPSRDSAFAGLEAFVALERALEAEAKQLQALRDSIEPVETAMSAAKEAARQLQVPLNVYDDTERWTRAADEQVRQLQAAVSGINAHRRFVADLVTNLAEFVERESVQTLMQHGWFPDLDLTAPQIEGWAEVFHDHPDQANEALCDRFRELLNDIESKVKSAFPNRSEILSEAFHAHRQCHYFLSVLAFLTQVDGFFHDLWEKSLFIGGDRQAVEGRVGEMRNALAREMVRVLLDSDWPLIMARKVRPADFNELNRHQVLHGEVTDYGTEENSLKAISLLNYCAFVLP